MTEKDASIVLNDAKYKLAIILQNARFGPELYVKPNMYVKNNDAPDAPDVEANKVNAAPSGNDAAANSEIIVLVKQDGKYEIVSGFKKVASALDEGKGFKARFLSSVALKKAKVYVEDLSQQSLATNPANDVNRRSSTRPEYANQRDPDNGYSRYSHARGSR